MSHIAGTDIVASMVVFQDGRPKKRDYKRFKLENMPDQDDYAAMRQVIARRFAHYQNADEGFAEPPDLLLIDGGAEHARTVCEALASMQLHFPVCGMVKDDRHRTRALVWSDGREVGIASVPSVFALIGTIQEETHRFAITYHKKLRSRRLQQSELDAIPGVGKKRKEELLRRFGSLKAIRAASRLELENLLPRPTAEAVYHHFHQNEE